MKLEMKTGFAVMLLILFVTCIFCVGWVSVAGAVELPSTPTLAPTMNPFAPEPTYPPPMPTPNWNPGDYRFEFYLPLVIGGS